MYKGGRWPFTPLYKLYKVGDRDYFTKGKRRYYCEVKALQEVKTGFNIRSYNPLFTNNFKHTIEGRRYWQFTYLVQIIEN